MMVPNPPPRAVCRFSSRTAAVSLAAGRSFVHANTVIGGASFSVYVAHIGWNSEGDRQARELVAEAISLLASSPEDRVVFSIDGEGSLGYEVVPGNVPGTYGIRELHEWQMRHQ